MRQEMTEILDLYGYIFIIHFWSNNRGLSGKSYDLPGINNNCALVMGDFRSEYVCNLIIPGPYYIRLI